jgi:hypothetical protein
MQLQWIMVVTWILVPWVTGCQRDTATPTAPAAGADATKVDGANLRLPVEPAGAADVITARQNVADGDDVLIVGRIGGGENPWVEGRAAFSIVDASLKACSDIAGDACETPWDYCCETDRLATATALVKLVAEDGTLIKADARALLEVRELDTVIVQGTAQRDDVGNLTVLGTGVYVQPR